MNKPKPKDKPFTIPKQLVWEAYRRVAANKGAPGVDGQDLDDFEADLESNLYCKDSSRRGEHAHTAVTFLGYAFRPREAVNGKTGAHFTSFSPAISPEALKAKSDRLRELRIHRHTNLSLDDLAEWLNPIIAGWMNYYGRYYRSALEPLLRRVSFYLRRWAGKKYKRLRTHNRFQRWWAGLLGREPDLFAHWQWVRAY